MTDPLPPWYIPPDLNIPITVPPPDPGTPPGWPGYNPAPSPTPSAGFTDSLTVKTPAINFPPPSLPIMDANGNMNPAWYQVLLTLFKRTGSNDTLGTTAGTDLAIGGDRVAAGQIDALRQEIASLRAELALSRAPHTAPRDDFGTLATLMRQTALHGPSAGEIYAFIRR